MDTRSGPGGPSPELPSEQPRQARPTDSLGPFITAVHHRYIDVDGTQVFVREAGPRDGPTVLLLHGFPTSSFQFRRLIPALADTYHVVAPDYPGFGFTEVASPDTAGQPITFDKLATTVERLTDVMDLRRYALYVFDYGAPVGFRLAERRPERVSALVIQNGNSYEEGLGDAWAPVRAYWADPRPARRDALRGLFTAEGLRSQYQPFQGVTFALIADELPAIARLIHEDGSGRIVASAEASSVPASPF